MKISPCFIFLFALLTPALRASDSYDWQSVSANGGKATLQMPGKPTKTTQSQGSLVGDVSSVILTVTLPADGAISIDCSDLPGAALFFAGADTIYSNAKGSFLSKVHGKADSWASVTLDGHQGMKLMFRTPPMDDHPGYDGEAQFYLVGNSLYVISVMDKVGDELGVQNKVFSSLQFTSDS